MAGIAPTSRNELSQRRTQLRRQRRDRFLKASWRSIAVLGLAGATVWAVAQPNWILRRSEQVEIEGNQFLSAKTVRSLLPIHYPESLLKVQPTQIAETLKEKAPIAEVSVERHLFPPGLTVRIRERKPVAQAIIAADSPDNPKPAAIGAEITQPSSSPSGSPPPSSDRPQGLLDETGLWIPIETYTKVGQSLQLPPLKLLGNPDSYRSHWSEFYPILRQSPVKVQMMDWRNPGNLILATDVGVVHLGPYSHRFFSQLKAIDRLRDLPKRMTSQPMEYLDLRNPSNPIVQLRAGKTSTKIPTP